MANVDELIVKIGADFADLKSELKKAGNSVEKLEDKTQKAGKSMAKSFGSIKKAITPVAAAITAATAATTLIVGKQLEAARATELWADRLSISRTEFSQLAAVGRRFGADMDDVGDAIKDLNERIADAAGGNKTYEEALKKAGLASKDLINLPLEEQFIKVADAIGKLNNAGDQNFVTAELMADAGFRLLPVFREGEEAIRKMKEEVLETNEALSDMQIQEMKEANKSLRDLSAAFVGFANALTVKLAPAITKAIEVLDNLSDAVRGDEAVKKLSKSWSEAGDEAKRTAQNMASIFDSDEKWNKSIQERDAALDALKQTKDALFGESSSGSPVEKNESKSGDGKKDDDGIFELAATPISGRELGLLEEYLNDQKGIIEAAREVESQEKEAWRNKELEREREFAKKNVMIWESGLKGRLDLTSKVLGDISVLMNSKNREMFEIGKAAAIAQVAIDTPKAAMSAYSAMAGIPIVGPALGAVAAAAAIATGVTQLQAISSTNFGGGGGGLGAGGIGGGGVAGQEQGEQTQVLETNVTFTGDTITQDQFRSFAAGLNEAIDDGVTIGRINT